MRIVNYAIALLVLLSSAAFAESVMINNGEAKIRSGPGTGYTVLWRPRLFTPFELLAKYDHWYAVRDVEGDVGWIHDSVVTRDGAAIVTGDLINVHESADKDSRILYQAPKNYTFKVKESGKGGWLHVVDPDNDTGWIAAKEVWTGTKQAEKAEKPEKAEKKSKKKSSKEPNSGKKKKK